MHLSWAVRRLTPIQARYIRLFYGAEMLHQLEELEQRGTQRRTAARGNGWDSESKAPGSARRRAAAQLPSPSVRVPSSRRSRFPTNVPVRAS